MSPDAWQAIGAGAGALGIIVAAAFSVRAAKLSKPTGNGFAGLVKADLAYLRTTIDAHVASSSTRHSNAEAAAREAVTTAHDAKVAANQARAATEVLRRELAAHASGITDAVEEIRPALTVDELLAAESNE